MINKGLFTSLDSEAETPQALFDELDKEFHFNLDVCATKENAKCGRYYTKEDNALADWCSWGERVFMNPPYGREIGKWIAKAWVEAQTNAEVVVCLLPARTDTAWWHDYCMKGEIRFIRGRLRFGKHSNSAPFPSAIVIFRNPH